MKLRLATWNLISIIAVIIVNGLIASRGLAGKTMQGLSAQYDNLFSPANYAFSIWSLIFIALLVHGIYYYREARNAGEDNTVLAMGNWLLIANIGNCLWLILFLNDWLLASVITMLVILYSLIQIILNLNMQRQAVSIETKRYAWLPISLYSGWITVATVANIAAFLTKIGWFKPLAIQEILVGIVLFVCLTIYMLVLLRRNMTVFALVGVWAFIAIAVRHKQDNALVFWMAIACAVVLTVSCFYQWNKGVSHQPTIE